MIKRKRGDELGAGGKKGGREARGRREGLVRGWGERKGREEGARGRCEMERREASVRVGVVVGGGELRVESKIARVHRV